MVHDSDEALARRLRAAGAARGRRGPAAGSAGAAGVTDPADAQPDRESPQPLHAGVDGSKSSVLPPPRTSGDGEPAAAAPSSADDRSSTSRDGSDSSVPLPRSPGDGEPAVALPSSADNRSSISITMGLLQTLVPDVRVRGNDAALVGLGVNSLGAVSLARALSDALGIEPPLPPTFLYKHPTPQRLADAIDQLLQPAAPGSAPTAPAAAAPGRPAGATAAARIDGTSALLPAGGELQYLVTCAHDAVSETPATRWDALALPAAGEGGRRLRHGACVRGAQRFDGPAFGVSPAEAAAMDPQQRLLLEHAYAALHGAGLDRVVLDESGTGVFLGIGASGFGWLLEASPLGATVYAATGASLSIAAGRLSYALGLLGPCVSYDTACSSALAAAHAAWRGLQLDECMMGAPPLASCMRRVALWCRC